MIEMYRVTKEYPTGIKALSDIDLIIDEGEFCFLSGPSGAGKSTFIRLLMSMDPITEGQIIVNGRNLRMLRPNAIPYLRRNIGAVFQDFQLLSNRTVFENVAIALEILGIPMQETRARVEQTLDLVGLSRYHQAYPSMLSGGEQQRVAIARALVNSPSIILADEPTGNLDPELSVEIIQLIQDIHRKGTTVVIATHDNALIERFGGRVLSLDNGYMVGDTAPTRIIDTSDLPSNSVEDFEANARALSEQDVAQEEPEADMEDTDS